MEFFLIFPFFFINIHISKLDIEKKKDSNVKKEKKKLYIFLSPYIRYWRKSNTIPLTIFRQRDGEFGNLVTLGPDAVVNRQGSRYFNDQKGVVFQYHPRLPPIPPTPYPLPPGSIRARIIIMFRVYSIGIPRLLNFTKARILKHSCGV